MQLYILNAIIYLFTIIATSCANRSVLIILQVSGQLDIRHLTWIYRALCITNLEFVIRLSDRGVY